MRLSFHYHIPAMAESGKIILPGYLGCFIDSLASYCDKVTCFLHSPARSENFIGDYHIRSNNVEWVDIGIRKSVPYRTLFAGRYVRPLVGRQGWVDALLVRGPSPLLPAFAEAAKNIPVVLLLVGDYLAGIDDLPQPRWRKELIRLYSYWNQKRQLAVAKRSLTFVNSQLLYDQLKPFVPNLVETRTTTLSEGDFFRRLDTCQKPPYHLLYTGRIDRAKGLLEMVTALAELVNKGYDCVLDLVGMVEKGDPVLEELKQKARELNIPERVVFHGYKPLGPKLFEMYRQADIYLIASKSSEGFPRTIWEAMANSLPVVATRVGSIPGFIEGATELVEPGNSGELAMAVTRLLNDPELRKRNIKSGMELARQNTLERRSREMIACIEAYLQSKHE